MPEISFLGPLFGTTVNCLAILIGGLVGVLFGRALSERFRRVAIQACGLSVLIVGFQMALKAQDILILVASMIIGGLIGEGLKIEDWLVRAGDMTKKRLNQVLKRFPSAQADFTEGFVTATVLFTVGTMAIVGPFEEALTGNASILLTKAMLDGTTSVIFAASLGIGVIFSLFPVFLLQGSVALAADSLSSVVSTAIIETISSTGGILILAIGLNVLKLTTVKVGNFLPALIVAAVLGHFFA